ncbi:MAG: helix-turn-helix domain-containing protein [Magnetococcales bacterium]|nr:helix-turn-helix domain-containing protein [Magnetococcales bacterium]
MAKPYDGTACFFDNGLAPQAVVSLVRPQTNSTSDTSALLREPSIEPVPHECAPSFDPRAEMLFARKYASKADKKRSDQSEVTGKLIDYDFLTVDEVAQLFDCAVRSVKNIPHDQLPSYPGPGRRKIYLREDLKIYLRNKAPNTPITDKVIQKALYSKVDGRRKRSQNGGRK